MSRFCSLMFVLALTLGTTACLETTLGNLTSSAPSPSSTRLSEINSQLASIENQKNLAQDMREAAENQMRESFFELSKLTGMGPKMPSGDLFEDPTADLGTMITMHNANMNTCRDMMNAKDAEIAKLNQEAAELKTERARLEQAMAQSSKVSSSSASPSCFTPDSRVRMAGGVKSIAAVLPGEEVLVYDEATGKLTYRRVLKAFQGREDHYCILNGEIRVTAFHRFLTEQGWMRAQDLEIGMNLKTESGWVPLKSKKWIKASVEVYNMEVEEHHDFFVLGDKENYLVHNTGGGGGGK